MSATNFSLPPREQMERPVQLWRDYLEIRPDVPFLVIPTWYYCVEEWRQQGAPENLEEWPAFFGYDPEPFYTHFG